MKTHFIRFSNTLLVLTGGIFLTTPLTQGAIYSWDGDTSSSWTDADNWDALPTNDLITDIANFNLATYGGDPVFAPNAGTTSISGITIGALNGAMTLTTTNLSIGNNGISIANGAGAFTIAGDVTLGAAQSWLNNSANLFSVGGVNLTNGGFLLTVGGSGNTAISSAIVGTGGLTKQDAGILTLSGSNSYSGVTTVSNGALVLSNANTISGSSSVASGATLQLGHATSMGSSTMTLASGATLQLRNDSDTTFTAPIDTAPTTGVTYNFDVNQATGAGTGRTLTLGNLTFATSTSGSITNTINVTGGNGYILGLGTISTPSSTGGGPHPLIINATTAAVTIAKVSSGSWGTTLNFTGSNSATLGTFESGSNGPNAIQINGGTVTLGTTTATNGRNGGSMAYTLNSGTLNVTTTTSLANVNVSGTATAPTFAINGGTLNNTSASALVLPANSGINAYRPTITIGGDFTFGTSGNDLDLGNGAITLGTAAGTSRTITIASGRTLTLGGAISNGTTANSLIKLGAGTLTLQGTNSYSGGLTIKSGVVTSNNAGTGGNFLGSGTVTIGDTANTGAAATLQFNGSNFTSTNAISVVGNGVSTIQAVGWSQTLNGAITLSNNLSVISNNAGGSNLTFGGGITGTGNLVIQSNAANTASSAISFGTGALNFTGTITNSGTTTSATLSHTTISSNIGSNVTGVIQNSANSNLILSGTGNAYTGTTTLTSGILQGNMAASATPTSSFGTSSLQLNGGTLNLRSNGAGNGGTITVSNNVTVGGSTTINVDRTSANTGNGFALGTLSIGANTLNVTGANSYALSFGATTLTGDAIFNSTTADLTLGAIGETGGSRSLTKNGAGILTLSGAATYTGGSSVTGGTLMFLNTNTKSSSGTHAFGAGTTLGLGVASAGSFFTDTDITNAFSGTMTGNLSNVTVTATTNVAIDTAAGDFTYGASISGAPTKGLAKFGSNALTLSGTNTYTGTTTIFGGTLIASGGAAIANTGLVTLANTAGVTFQLNNNETIGNLSGGGTTGGVVALQGNTLTVGDATGTQTYAGTFTGTSASGIVKQGSGMLLLSNATSIPGTMTINAGTVQLGATNFSGGTITLNANNVAFSTSTSTVTGPAGVLANTISNDFVLSSSVTTTGATIGQVITGASGGTGRTNFTGSITGGATTGNFQTLRLTTSNDRTSLLYSGVISNGSAGGTLNVAVVLNLQTGSTAANEHPVNISLSGINTFTGTLTVTRNQTGGTNWLTIGGERWTDGSFGANNPTYGRMGSGYLGANNGGDYTGAINFGSTANQIVNLNYFSSANQTWSGVIGGGGNNQGALVKEGSGTLTLTNQNLYSSLTTIGGGKLLLGFNNATPNILPSTTSLWMGLGRTYAPIVTNARQDISGGGGGGILELAGSHAGSTTQTVASLTTAANTTSSIVIGANRTLAITSGAIQAGASHAGPDIAATISTGGLSGLNFNTAAGGADAATTTIGTSIVQFGGAVTGLTNGFTVTDSTGFGLATTNGSNQIIRNTATAALVASGGSSATNYQTTSSSGNSVTATQSVGSITTDTSGGNVILTLSGGVTLRNNVWNFGGNGSNTAQVTGGTGVTAVASNNAMILNNFNTGAVTFSSGILANGTNALIVGGTGTVSLAGLNTFTGATTINSGNLQISGSGRLNGGTYAGAIAINGGSALRYSSSQGQTLSGVISGPGGIIKDTNTSDLTLSGTNIYTGTTTVSAGRIMVTTVANLSSGGTSIVQSGTGQIYTTGTGLNFSNNFNISTTGYVELADVTSVDGAIRSDGNNTFSGIITLSGNSRIGAYGNARVNTITGQITGSGAMSFYGLNSANNDTQTYIISNTANNYTGDTQIDNKDYQTARTGNSTTLRLGASNVIPDGANAGNIAFNGASAGDLTILDLFGYNDTINGLSAVAAAGARITNTAAAGNSVLTIGANNATSSFSGTITDSGVGRSLAITKTGNGIITLSGTNTYIGATNVNAGTLAVNGAGSINNSAVTINGGNFRYNSSVNYTGTLTHTSGRISGTNWNGSLSNRTIGANQIISPGNSPGTAATGGQTWAAGGSYEWEINSTLGSAGADPGWDLINGTGTLTIAATAGNEFSIDITSLTLGNLAGNVSDFNEASNYSWLIAEFATISGFDSTDFILDDSAFSNIYSGTFGLAFNDGATDQIFLTYTAIPEPKAALLGALGLLLLLRRRR